MDFFEVVKERSSIRKFASQSIEGEKLKNILEAINRAPSAGNQQAYEVYLVTDAERKSALANAAYNQSFIAEATIVFVFCAHPARNAERYGERGERLYSLQDATIACTFAMLAATAQGLASVWVGAFMEDAIRHIIGSPNGQMPMVILPIGYPAQERRIKPRRPLEELIHRL